MDNPNEEENKKMDMPEKAKISVVEKNKDMSDAAINAVENFVNTTDHTHNYTIDSVKGDKVPAILCYIPFVSLFFLANKKKISNDYFRFHINQGLIITIIWFLTIVLSKILTSLFNSTDDYTHTTPGIVYFIVSILYIGTIMLSLFGIVNTAENKSKELPIVGKIRFFS